MLYLRIEKWDFISFISSEVIFTFGNPTVLRSRFWFYETRKINTLLDDYNWQVWEVSMLPGSFEYQALASNIFLIGCYIDFSFTLFSVQNSPLNLTTDSDHWRYAHGALSLNVSSGSRRFCNTLSSVRTNHISSCLQIYYISVCILQFLRLSSVD